MKKRYVIIASMMLATAFLATACGTVTGGGGNEGGGGEGGGDPVDQIVAPDYSAYTDQFESYGYQSAHDGYYSVDDASFYVGESFMTTEQYQLYKDAGMNVFYPQSKLKIRGEAGSMFGDALSQEAFYLDRANDWQKAKAEIDKLAEVGITKTILYDEDLAWLGLNNYTGKSLLEEGGYYYFESEEALDAQVYALIKDYAGQSGVYGVCLADEPRYSAVKPYADLYHSIQRVCADKGFELYIHYNLNPLNLSRNVYENYYPHTAGTTDFFLGGTAPFEDGFIRYKQYMEDYLDTVKPISVQYDDYPLRINGSGNAYLSQTYIPCLQYVAGQARDRDIDFRMVTQTFDMSAGGTNHSTRIIDEAGAKWLNNMLIGFGARSISYFTYFTKLESRTDGEYFHDGGSFLTMFGQKTKIYDIMQTVITNNQKFAPTVLQFKYQKSGVFQTLPMKSNGAHLFYVEGIGEQTYEKVKSVSVNKECAMVNELYDAENGNYMYMAMNIVDPLNKGSNYFQTITLEFSSEYQYAAVYKDGECLYYRLKNGKLDIKGAPGDASFVIPFN